MNELSERIQANAEDPDELERLYRAAPSRFRDAFMALKLELADSLLLQAWRARLAAEQSRSNPGRSDFAAANPARVSGLGALGLVVFLALVAGTLARLPLDFSELFRGGGTDEYYARHIAFFVFPALFVLLAYFKRTNWRSLVLPGLGILACLTLVNLVPTFKSVKSMVGGHMRFDALMLIYLHVPVVLLFLTSLVFRPGRDARARMEVVRAAATSLIYTVLILIGGMVLSGFTLGLFALIDINIQKIYFEYIVLYGTVASPIVAVYLAQLRGNLEGLSSILARTFAPLALITLAVYLGFLGYETGKRGALVYRDQTMLVIVNVVLMLVLALALYSLIESRSNRVDVHDRINVSLMCVGILLGVFILGACLHWIIQEGWSPFRVAALVLNLVLVGNLCLMFFLFIKLFLGKIVRERVQDIAVKYLAVYGVYAAAAAFVLGPAYILS